MVPSLATLTTEVQMAAAFLGARVQEQLLVPALKFKALSAHVFAFSPGFCQKHKRLVPIIRAVAARPVVGQGPRFIVTKRKAFLEEVSNKVNNEGDAWKKNMTCLYSSADETETKSLSEAGTQVARTTEEFLRFFCSTE